MRPFPYDPERLTVLARSANEEIAWAALHAMELVRHPKVHSLAFEIANDPKWAAYAVGLLVHNYEEGDLALVERLLETDFEDGDYHHLGIDLRQLLKANPTVNGERALTLLYEKGPCSLCREDVIELLSDRHRLPDWMREECRYDADPDTREMVSSFKPSGDGETTSR